MRLGELDGLDWPDIDLDNGLLNIDKALQHLKGRGTFVKSPKNESSIRVISLPDSVISIIREYKLWQNGEKAKLGGSMAQRI